MSKDVKVREFVFEIGDRNFIIEADDEKQALHKLIDEQWPLISEHEQIDLMGEIIEKYKVDEMPPGFGEETEEEYEEEDEDEDEED